MKKLSSIIFGTGILLLAFTVRAETIHPASIPEAVAQNILKRYPSAQDLQGSHETHFGEKLLEVRYKDETGQTIMELFTSHGHLFTNELLIEDFDEIDPAVINTLKKEFPHYQITQAELIGNPNGSGEEYEIYLQMDSTDWKVSITEKGLILEKQADIVMNNPEQYRHILFLQQLLGRHLLIRLA
jgi:hypothetical protein